MVLRRSVNATLQRQHCLLRMSGSVQTGIDGIVPSLTGAGFGCPNGRVQSDLNRFVKRYEHGAQMGNPNEAPSCTKDEVAGTTSLVGSAYRARHLGCLLA